MELRKRQAKILQDLFEKKRISVDAILNEYGISKRTLYYDLNKINDWLSEDNFGMASIEDKEIVIEITNLAGIERILFFFRREKGDRVSVYHTEF